MPGRRFTEDQELEIVSRYTAGERSPALAAAYRCDRSLICHILARHGISPEPFSPFIAGRLHSPFSAARLHELYWRDGLSLAELAARAADLLGRRRLSSAVVARWLQDADITIRTPAEGQRVRARVHAAEARRHAHKYLMPNRAAPSRFPGPTPAVHRLGVKAAAALKRATAHETRTCALPWCTRTITRRRSAFHVPPDRTCCCRAHSNELRARRRRTAPVPLVLPPWAQDVHAQRTGRKPEATT
jgi:hypothetical protein